MSKKSSLIDAASPLLAGGLLGAGGIPGLSTSSSAQSGVRGDQFNSFSTGAFDRGGFDPVILLAVAGGVLVVWWAIR